MIGAKSVPALPKKYSTPRAASNSRYASAVVSMFAFLVMGALAVSVFEPPELRGSSVEAESLPPRGHGLVDRPAEHRALGELLEVPVFHARVDQRLGPVR